LLEHMFNVELALPCGLIWIATSQARHYRHNLCRSWEDAIDEFSYLAVKSESEMKDAVSSHWLRSFNGADVYVASGGQSVLDHVLNMGLNPSRIVTRE